MSAEIKVAFASDLIVLTGQNRQTDLEGFPFFDADRLLCEGIAGIDMVIRIMRDSVYSAVKDSQEVDHVV